MSQFDSNNYQQRVVDLKVDGHLMSLNTGLYCIYHAPNQASPDKFGFPGVRLSLPPFQQSSLITIKTFEDDGWIGGEKNAALVRVVGGAALILVTVYQNPAYQHSTPKLQVVRLNDASELTSNQPVQSEANRPETTQSADFLQAQSKQDSKEIAAEDQQKADLQIVAHVQRIGDTAVTFGNWVGKSGSKTWIEGFGIATGDKIDSGEIEYQAVLGKGWLSPWYKGNQFCGSRGMALPLLGLCIRLKGEAEKHFRCRVSATFIDGTQLGPVEDGEVLSSESLAPLEAFSVDLIPIGQEEDSLDDILFEEDSLDDAFLEEEVIEKQESQQEKVITKKMGKNSEKTTSSSVKEVPPKESSSKNERRTHRVK